MAVFGQTEIQKQNPVTQEPGMDLPGLRVTGFSAHGRNRIFNEAGTVDDRRCFGLRYRQG
jgi:hypothetical protein